MIDVFLLGLILFCPTSKNDNIGLRTPYLLGV
jgi:hypothetical protein